MSMGNQSSISAAQTVRIEQVFAMAVVVVIAVLVLPLPTALLDLFLAANLAVTVILLLMTLAVKEPLELSVFPSLLLLSALGRLALNVASTRLILLQGDAGKIISTFGNFVVGGNLVVGLVIFLILVVIQFVVITKGAGRISEVGARFILDAMPGKQMAIDADLNAGMVDEKEAKRRRLALMKEAEFYGSMDGASKFVRGDAIAGLIITAINLVGGITIGFANGLPLIDSVRKYSILSVGDGLVSQVPALIIATAAGMLVTKGSSENTLGPEIFGQFFRKKTPLAMGSLMLVGLALVPGLPKIPFFLLAGILWFVSRQAEVAPPAKEEKPAPTTPTLTPMEEHLNEFLEVDRVCVEIGARLIPMLDPKRGLSLLQRIGTLRRDLARRCGLWIPLVRVRDNVDLEPERYAVMVNGQEVARGVLRYGQLLAISSSGSPIMLRGEDTLDPAFGLTAKWIAENDRAQAELAGYTVVDAPSVLITHLREILRRHAHELLSREDLSKLLDKAKEHSAAVVDELIPSQLSAGSLHRILCLLLEERVPITNLTRILESLASNISTVKDPVELTERVRTELCRAICEPFVDERAQLHAIVFDPRLELELRKSLHDKRLAIDPDQLERLIVKLATECRNAAGRRQEIALLVDSSLRRPMRNLLARSLPDLTIISFTEVPNDVMLEPEVIVRVDEIMTIRPTAGQESGLIRK